MSSLIPNGEQRFVDNNGRPLIGGRVYYYVPNTSTLKDTWQDESMTILNTNPIVLDARGECTAWGYGSYRQVVRDDKGNLIWDKLVTDFTSKISEAVDALRDELASTDDGYGAQMIGFRQDQPGAISQTVDSKLRQRVSVKDFGAIGDGVADDSAALLLAVKSGAPLDWGGVGDVYRITTDITWTAAADIDWVSNGAVVIYGGAADATYMMQVDLDGHNFTFTGPLVLDFADLGHVPLFVRNDSDVFVDFRAKWLCARNGRKTIASQPCEGLTVRGAFLNVILDEPKLSRFIMSPGSGIPGVAGVRGAGIFALSSSRYPVNVEVLSPAVSDIYSLDSTYASDQDGLSIFGPEDQAGTFSPWRQRALVSKGLFRNCNGRSVKIQNEFSLVEGIHIERDIAPNTDIAPWGVEIDFQTGGGTARDITCRYFNGAVPRCVVLGNTPALSGKVTPWPSVQGIKIYTDAPASRPMQTVVQIASRNITDRPSLVANDIDVVGNVSEIVRINALNGSTGIIVSLTDVRASPLLSLVRAEASSGTGTVKLARCFNFGSSTVPLFSRTSTNQVFRVSADDCEGWFSASTIGAGTWPDMKRVSAIAPMNATIGFQWTPFNFQIADGETVIFPPGNVSGQFDLQILGSAQTAGSFGFDASQVIQYSGGNVFTVGGTSEPATGSYRLWTGTDGPRLTNRSGSTRTVSLQIVR